MGKDNASRYKRSTSIPVLGTCRRDRLKAFREQMKREHQTAKKQSQDNEQSSKA
jgi:hypothetical protein